MSCNAAASDVAVGHVGQGLAPRILHDMAAGDAFG